MRRDWSVLIVASALALLSAPCASSALSASDWTQFRGPGGQGLSSEKGLPVQWSSTKNIVWKSPLPGPGTSSPVVVGKQIFLTCYTGYAIDAAQPGDMQKLKRHLLCIGRDKGQILWSKEFSPVLPEHEYVGEGSYHGYSSSTPTSDGERLYVFFGKSGVYCFDLDGKELWHKSVGTGIHRWGSATSPLLYKNLLIVNASVESRAIVALDKLTGTEVWRVERIRDAWNTPVLVTAANETELVLSGRDKMLGFDPLTGKELWTAEGVHRYVCPSVVAHDGVVYAIGGGHTSLAVKAGGRGDVTKTHVVWRVNKGSNVSSPVYYEGHLYWASEKGGILYCQDPQTGKFVFSQRLSPAPDLIYASPLLADGKLYLVSQHHGTYVVAARPKFELLAHNVFKDDSIRSNASPAVSLGQLLLRDDEALYCIGNRPEAESASR